MEIVRVISVRFEPSAASGTATGRQGHCRVLLLFVAARQDLETTGLLPEEGILSAEPEILPEVRLSGRSHEIAVTGGKAVCFIVVSEEKQPPHVSCPGEDEA